MYQETESQLKPELAKFRKFIYSCELALMITLYYSQAIAHYLGRAIDLMLELFVSFYIGSTFMGFSK